MVAVSGREHSLPLLPSGATLFADLPAEAVVLDALAPAIGEGVITVRDGFRAGILVVRNGRIDDAVCADDGGRTSGDVALSAIRGWGAASVSASRLNDQAMAIIGPVIHGAPCYADLRLEWTDWSQLLTDLRHRGGTFVVELQTPTGRGVTLIQAGRQLATYTESHPSLGEADLLDALASVGTGAVRVLVEPDAAAVAVDPVPEPVSISTMDMGTAPRSLPPPMPLATTELAEVDAAALAYSVFDASRAEVPQPRPLIAFDQPRPGADPQVTAVLPELIELVRTRLQRSSGPLEEIIEAASLDGRSLTSLAEQVRAMRIRGFVPATFERLADDMLAMSDPRDA